MTDRDRLQVELRRLDLLWDHLQPLLAHPHPQAVSLVQSLTVSRARLLALGDPSGD